MTKPRVPLKGRHNRAMWAHRSNGQDHIWLVRSEYPVDIAECLCGTGGADVAVSELWPVSEMSPWADVACTHCRIADLEAEVQSIRRALTELAGSVAHLRLPTIHLGGPQD